ncbi:MAG: heparinase II/III family protein, partial [Pseudomonadota bacterium]
TYFSDLEIGTTRGADIKMPWELGRLQHLPRMALCAVLSSEAAATLQREVRNQILDFIASNPPQFGANWGCPMDVGIRAANLCLAVDLFEQAGLPFDTQFHAVLCASLTDHGRHIASHLEWAPEGRSNHYLSDLVGLVFLGAYLPPTEETLGWLAYGVVEMAAETLNQFHADGGNYEGSVGYHRLSSELVTYAFALVLGLPGEVARRLRDLEEKPDRFALVPVAGGLGPRAAAILAEPGPELVERLAAIASFMDATAAPNGRMAQIGDTDSGRLFKLDVALMPGVDDQDRPAEDELSVMSSLFALKALFPEEPSVAPGSSLSAAVVRAMCGDSSLAAAKDRANTPSSDNRVTRNQDREGAPRAERLYRFEIPDAAVRDMTVEAFPEFGLWVWRTPRLHLTFRCAGHHRSDAPYGHTHDDNLALTLWVDGEWRIEDPGTYVYTSFPELRNAYRKAAAHFVPRAREWDAVTFDPTYLFDCRQRVTARMMRADVDAAEAEMANGSAVIRRAIDWADGLVVKDRAWGCSLDSDVPSRDGLRVGLGYGRLADTPQRFPGATEACA